MDFNSVLKKYAEHIGESIDNIQTDECVTFQGKLNFFKVGNLLINIYGFDYIDSELYSILKKLKMIKSKNKLHIIFAENKDKANILCKKHFKQELIKGGESQYSLLIYNDEIYIFFHYSRLKKENIEFLIEYLDRTAYLLPNEQIQEKVHEIYWTIILEYVKSVGFRQAVKQHNHKIINNPPYAHNSSQSQSFFQNFQPLTQF